MSRISLVVQEGALKSYFPKSIIKRKGIYEFIWEGRLQPTVLSPTYTVKLHHKIGKSPKVYVLDPMPLELPAGELELPHVYSTKEQRLCLYYPKEKEWTANMLYVHSLIPWASEWLLHYELFVSTGVWHGGGIEHDTCIGKSM